MLRPAKLILVLQRLLNCSPRKSYASRSTATIVSRESSVVSESRTESSVVSESRTDKLIAPEGLKVGNIEDVKNTYRAGGTKQKTVRNGKSPEYSEINC